MQQSTLAKVQGARAAVRQRRALGQAKKLAKAEKKLQKLQAKEVRPMLLRCWSSCLL